MAIALFCDELKGKSMLALSRDVDVQYKTAFVLARKLRDAMAGINRPRIAGYTRRNPGSAAPPHLKTRRRIGGTTWSILSSRVSLGRAPGLIALGSSVQDGTSASFFAMRPIAG